jgi:hypothetical protein
MTRTLIITFHQEGFHQWKEAPRKRGYLSTPHRHLFHFRCEFRVRSDERELEFHDLLEASQRELWMSYSRLTDYSLNLTDESCETIAAKLWNRLVGNKLPCVAVEVWEDGECGARVED